MTTDERFHRSLDAEVLKGRSFESLAKVQVALDRWRAVYNHERPHQALQMATPITRYRPSARRLPARLGEPEYASCDEVRTVGCNGELRFRSARHKGDKCASLSQGSHPPSPRPGRPVRGVLCPSPLPDD